MGVIFGFGDGADEVFGKAGGAEAGAEVEEIVGGGSSGAAESAGAGDERRPGFFVECAAEAEPECVVGSPRPQRRSVASAALAMRETARKRVTVDFTVCAA